VRNNTRLPGVLEAFSANLPPPTVSSADPNSQIWTLDELFLLPMGRLKYFKKLYGRLLKRTQPGRSDHKLLADAAEKLDKLLTILDARATVLAGSTSPTASVAEDEVVVDLRSPTSSSHLNFAPIFNAALDAYERKTKKDLAWHPLFRILQSCDSPAAILAVLREQISASSQSQNGDDQLIKSVTPIVNVLFSFSTGLGRDVWPVNIGMFPREKFLL
jgi:hypothetical protein